MAYITNDEGTRWVDDADSPSPVPSPASDMEQRARDWMIANGWKPEYTFDAIDVADMCAAFATQERAAERKRVAQMLDDQGCPECAAAIRKLEER